MPLEPVARKLVQMLRAAGLGVGPETTPESGRAAMELAAAGRSQPRREVHAVEDRAIPGPAGPIPVRVYRPSDAPSRPVVVWLHGGGWVVGSIQTHDHLCRMLCDDAQAVVVSVEYRLAPETKFPGAVDDCVAAWNWVVASASQIGGDPERVAVAGDSAGGNLAAVVSLVAREQGLATPKMQLLVYPVTDHEFDRPSMIENATGYFLERDGMRWYFDHYAGAPSDFDDWRLSPLRAPDLSGLPPALVVTAEYDPLRDQGEAYGERLREAGVPAEVLRVDGLFHGFFSMTDVLVSGRPAWDTAVCALRVAFGEAG